LFTIRTKVHNVLFLSPEIPINEIDELIDENRGV